MSKLDMHQQIMVTYISIMFHQIPLSGYLVMAPYGRDRRAHGHTDMDKTTSLSFCWGIITILTPYRYLRHMDMTPYFSFIKKLLWLHVCFPGDKSFQTGVYSGAPRTASSFFRGNIRNGQLLPLCSVSVAILKTLLGCCNSNYHHSFARWALLSYPWLF